MKTLLAVLIIAAVYIVLTAGMFNLFGNIGGVLFAFFGLAGVTITVTDALLNYEFFGDL